MHSENHLILIVARKGIEPFLVCVPSDPTTHTGKPAGPNH